MKLVVLTTAAVLIASAASAVTIQASATRPTGGVAFGLDPANFVAAGGPGSGLSIQDDPNKVTTKNRDSLRRFGRRAPLGSNWIDSNDNPKVNWHLSYEKPIKSLTFALTDAFDQPKTKKLGKSFFRLRVGDAVWSIPTREKNGKLHWITILFDKPTDHATLRFRTRLNDGWGISRAEISPVPLPAAAWMLVAGLGALVGFRSRARRV